SGVRAGPSGGEVGTIPGEPLVVVRVEIVRSLGQNDGAHGRVLGQVSVERRRSRSLGPDDEEAGQEAESTGGQGVGSADAELDGSTDRTRGDGAELGSDGHAVRSQGILRSTVTISRRTWSSRPMSPSFVASS